MAEQLGLFGGTTRIRSRLDADESRRRKDAGQATAAETPKERQEAIVAEARTWLKAQRRRGIRAVTIEEFRAQARNKPESHKFWGTLPRLLVKQGLLRGMTTAEGDPIYKPAAAPKTHAHPVRLWEITA